MTKQTLLRAAMALLVISMSTTSCLSFTAPNTLLEATSSFSLSSDTSLSATPRMDPSSRNVSSRKAFLNHILTLTTLTTMTPPSFADDSDQQQSKSPKIQPLPTYIYNILRVREATEQETRLISTGKFKDVQRANVKLAVKFMVNNYKLSDSIIAASSYLNGNARVQASGVGQSAVQSLYTILEYFDSSDVENIKVGSDSMLGKESIVTKGLESVRRDIDDFLAYFPQDVVAQAKVKIMEENELNFKEFDPSLGSILNPNPK